MTSCPSPEMLTDYLEGTLATAAEMHDLEVHLVDCSSCRQALRQMARRADNALVSALSIVPAEAACLDEETIARYVEDTADDADREWVEAHAADCRFCAEEIKSARAFRTQMQDYDWTAASAIADSYTWQHRARALFAQPRLWRGLVAAPAALAVTLLVLWSLRAAQRPFTLQVTRLQRQVRSLQQSQGTLAHKLQLSHEEAARAVAMVPHWKAEVSRIQEEAARLRRQNDQLVQKANTRPANAGLQQRVALNDGSGQLVIDPRIGPVRVQKLPTSVVEALTRQKLEMPLALADLHGRNSTLLGKGQASSFALISPISTFVLNDRPSFRWQRQTDATRYAVTLVDITNDSEIQSETIAPDKPGRQIEWTLPKIQEPLRRGGRYRWYVVATLTDGRTVQSPSRSAAPAMFQVLDTAAARSIRKAQETYADSPLTLGVLYARAGLLDDADRQIRAVLTSNPQSALARKLWQSLCAHSK